MAEETKRGLLHIQGQIMMLRDGLAVALGLGTLHLPWAGPLLREAFRQKTLNILGEGKEELEAGYQHMRDRLIELLDEAENSDTFKEFLDEIEKKDLIEIIKEMEKNPKKFLERIAMKKV